ncbi:hypothetical protein JRQ81_015617 [Phrynocephalus forsythii]|uniref:Uncharacterized protein n=1 Tax=Phrynocephalus forsythii TaxID=171643 RepID=A0A9Q0XUB0_9SAUR|nr:hypothetical protein JRQ81_015617 [Phrynocephalus forsythii]
MRYACEVCLRGWGLAAAERSSYLELQIARYVELPEEVRTSRNALNFVKAARGAADRDQAGGRWCPRGASRPPDARLGQGSVLHHATGTSPSPGGGVPFGGARPPVAFAGGDQGLNEARSPARSGTDLSPRQTERPFGCYGLRLTAPPPGKKQNKPKQKPRSLPAPHHFILYGSLHALLDHAQKLPKVDFLRVSLLRSHLCQIRRKGYPCGRGGTVAVTECERHGSGCRFACSSPGVGLMVETKTARIDSPEREDRFGTRESLGNAGQVIAATIREAFGVAGRVAGEAVRGNGAKGGKERIPPRSALPRGCLWQKRGV